VDSMLKLFSSYGRTSGVPYFEQENESTLNIPKMIRTFELGFFFFFFSLKNPLKGLIS